MRPGRWGMVLLGAFATAAVVGCAGKRIEHGVFHSPKGYRIAIPGDGWMVTPDSRADLELRRQGERRGMLVNAACAGESSKTTLLVLERHLLAGLRERTVVSEEEATLGGRPARHTVVEGRFGDAAEPVRVELYVMRDGRCVYDFLYAAPAVSFEAARAEFQRFVETFSVE